MDYQRPFLDQGFESTNSSQDGSYFHFYSREVFAFMVILPNGEIVLKGEFIEKGVDFYWRFPEEQLEEYVAILMELRDCVGRL